MFHCHHLSSFASACRLLAASVLLTLATAAAAEGGVEFSGCSAAQRDRVPREMAAYLRELGVARDLVVRTERPDASLVFALDASAAGDGTLDLSRRLHLTEERVALPAAGGRVRHVNTVSRREILLALLQPGRTTRFHGPACELTALREQVGLRQNIVAWVEELHWIWPDGGEAGWNPAHWDEGSLRPGVPLDRALRDAFERQPLYSIGCYTATKLAYAHGVLDYYVRVARDPNKAALVRQRLLNDGDPLVDVEPPGAWEFMPDFEARERDWPGKLATLQRGVPAGHLVPGDWIYLLNTDPISWNKTGYEGSNAIYLGRGLFDDYYNDHGHRYTFEQKLDEVYQWRNGVFSRRRDAALAQALTEQDYRRLALSPGQGGLLFDWRLVPWRFGWEPLPALQQR